MHRARRDGVDHPLAQSQVVAATDLLRHGRDVSELEGRQSTDQEFDRARSGGIARGQSPTEAQIDPFPAGSPRRIDEKQAELAVVRESMRAAADRVNNTDIRSPGQRHRQHALRQHGGRLRERRYARDGYRPGRRPASGRSQGRPQDIAFIHPGQRATVKVTAYDFSIYGGLDGKVEQVSASSIYDDMTRETFYTVLVKTENSTLTTQRRRESDPAGHGHLGRHPHRREERSQLSPEADQQGTCRSASRALSARRAMDRDQQTALPVSG